MHDSRDARLNSGLYLTTGEVAEVLDVHPSTVRRWCEADEVPLRTTSGGHRRIHLSDALELARVRGIDTYLASYSPYQAHVWQAVRESEERGDFRRIRSLALGWLVLGFPERIGRLFRALGRRSRMEYASFIDEAVRGFMSDVGEAWRDGRLRVGDEHQASRAVQEALLSLREQWLGRDGRHGATGAAGRDAVAVVGSAEGNQHALGSLSIRILLERRGWRVAYLGPDIPLEEFSDTQQARRASLMCVSVSGPGAEGMARRAFRVLGRLHDPAHPCALAIGGTGLSVDVLTGAPSPFLATGTFAGVGDFGRWLREEAGLDAPESNP